MEAIILAGGKAERLGDAAGGRPKALVEVAGKPLAAYQVGRLARAGVTRVIFACAAGRAELFERELAGLGPEIVAAEEPERLGRGGGIKFAARQRQEDGDVFALNGDELVDVDFARPARRAPRRRRARDDRGRAAAVAVRARRGRRRRRRARASGGRPVPYWVNCGNYVLCEEAIARFPDKGDHESTTFPELAAEGQLRAFRHEGLWLTVNTPKELRAAPRSTSSRTRSGSRRERIAARWTRRISTSLDRWRSTCGASRSRGATS